VSFVSVDFDFYSDILIFFDGFTAAKIPRRIRLAEFFSADIRRTKIPRLIQIFGGGLGSTYAHPPYSHSFGVLSHWAHFTVRRFICVHLCVFCVFLFYTV